MVNGQQRILIIKHGALGDIILASAGFKAIREAYPTATITCLTGKAYASLLAQCPWIDAVEIDSKPKFWRISRMRALSKQLKRGAYTHVFDLQNSTRSHSYRFLFGKHKPVMSRSVNRAERLYKHAHTRLVEQLHAAGITPVPLPDISWLAGETTSFDLVKPYALIAAGGAAHRPEKRWPAQHFVTLCSELVARGVTPVLIGTDAEADVIDTITRREPAAIALTGKTNFGQIATLARGAVWAMGNDTGPMHIMAATGTPSTVLFSHASSPERSAPVGDHVQSIQYSNLSQLLPDEVLASFPGEPQRQKTA